MISEAGGWWSLDHYHHNMMATSWAPHGQTTSIEVKNFHNNLCFTLSYTCQEDQTLGCGIIIFII